MLCTVLVWLRYTIASMSFLVVTADADAAVDSISDMMRALDLH